VNRNLVLISGIEDLLMIGITMCCEIYGRIFWY